MISHTEEVLWLSRVSSFTASQHPSVKALRIFLICPLLHLLFSWPETLPSHAFTFAYSSFRPFSPGSPLWCCKAKLDAHPMCPLPCIKSACRTHKTANTLKAVTGFYCPSVPSIYSVPGTDRCSTNTSQWMVWATLLASSSTAYHRVCQTTPVSFSRIKPNKLKIKATLLVRCSRLLH